MQELIARGAKSIDICLRTIHAHKQEFKVNVCEDEKGRVYYQVELDTNQDVFESIKREYEMLIKK